MKNCKRLALLLAVITLLTVVFVVGAAAADKPQLSICAANLSFEDSVYVVYAVDAENFPADQVKMLFFPQFFYKSNQFYYV